MNVGSGNLGENVTSYKQIWDHTNKYYIIFIEGKFYLNLIFDKIYKKTYPYSHIKFTKINNLKIQLSTKLYLDD